MQAGPLHIYIGTGVKGAQYTIRLKYLYERHVMGMGSYWAEGSQYLANAGTNWEHAVTKATEYAANSKVPLLKQHPFPLNPYEDLGGTSYNGYSFDLCVKRELNKEEIEKRYELVKQYRFRKDAKAFVKKVPYGKYSGMSVIALVKKDRAYAEWLLEKNENPFVKKYVAMILNSVIVSPVANSKHVGDLKQRIKDLEVTCIGKRSFNGFYGWVTHFEMVDNNGNLFYTKYSGDTWDMNLNESYTIAGTVTEHTTRYKDDNIQQTTLNRVKVL